jgi:hypothetical protein
MKVSLLNVVMFGSGAVLIYCGIKGYDPRDVMRWALGGEKPTKMGEGATDSFGDPENDQHDNLAPGPLNPEYDGGGGSGEDWSDVV